MNIQTLNFRDLSNICKLVFCCEPDKELDNVWSELIKNKMGKNTFIIMFSTGCFGVRLIKGRGGGATVNR